METVISGYATDEISMSVARPGREGRMIVVSSKRRA